MEPAIQFLISTVFFFSQITYAADTPAKLPFEARDPNRDAVVTTSQTEALKKGPKCDARLLDELNAHIHLHACLSNWDSNCWEMMSRVAKGVNNYVASGGLFSLGVSLNVVGSGMKHVFDESEITSLKNALGSPKYAAEAEKYQGLYRSAMNAENLELHSLKGKLLTSDQARLATLKTLEKLSSVESKSFSASVGALRRAISKKIFAETVAKYGLVIAASGGFLAVAAAGLAMSVDAVVSSTPTGGPCQDHAAAYIDYKPNETDSHKCDFSFSLTGGRVNRFMHESRENQIKILQNNAATCEYYYYLNEHLKGEIIPQIVAMQNIEFTKVPQCNKVPCPAEKVSCDHQEVKGVDYEVKVDGQIFNIVSRNDSETKRIRSILIKRLQDGREFDATDISYEDIDGGGSRPSIVTKKYVNPDSWEPAQVPFAEYGANAKDPRVQNTVNLLTKSQIWSPLVASCCTEDDPKKCIKEKLQLPGLTNSDGPSELQLAPPPKTGPNNVLPKTGEK